MKQFFKSFRFGGQLSGIAFVCLFAAVGAIFVLFTHAGGQFTANIAVIDTNSQNLTNVNVSLTGVNSSGCQATNDFNGQITVSCTAPGGPDAYFQVLNITKSGYQVSTNSDIQVGATYPAHQSATGGSSYKLIMQAVQQSPPPTPTPTPTPTPSPPASGGGGTTHTGGTTTHTSSGSTVKVSPSTSSSGSTDTTSNVQPATDATGDNLNSTSGTINVKQNSDSTVNSVDNLARVTFPAGTFDSDAFCSVDVTESAGMPAKAGDPIGPYSIDCTDDIGNPLTKFKHSVAVSVTVPSRQKTYTAYANDGNWKPVATEKGASSLKFKLAKDVVFGASPKATTNWGVIIIDILLVLLAIGVLIFIVRLIRNRQVADTPPPAYYE